MPDTWHWRYLVNRRAHVLTTGRVAGIVTCWPGRCQWAAACGAESMGSGIEPTLRSARRMVESRARFCPSR